jgi:hypothetical protein
MNPSCRSYLLAEGRRISIAEMAHVIAHSQDGPRGDSDHCADDSPDNLILLCRNCHKIIDGNESDYPPSRLQAWKKDHADRVSEAINVKKYESLKDLQSGLLYFIESNGTTWESFGPSEQRQDNIEAVEVWEAKVTSTIIPNNRRILMTLLRNKDLLSPKQLRTLIKYQQHVEEFEQNHIGLPRNPNAPKYTQEFNLLLRGY